MQGYGAAWTRRLASVLAVQDAQASVLVPQTLARVWSDGCFSLIPAPYGSLTPQTVVAQDWQAHALWIGEKSRLNYAQSELLWRYLSACAHRFVFEVAGNSAWVRLVVRTHKDDAGTLAEAVGALYPDCALRPETDLWWRLGSLSPVCVACAPDMSARLTLPDALPESLLWGCVEWLLGLNGDAVGYFQCVLEPRGADAQWHREIELRDDLHFLAKLVSAQGALMRLPQQIPSGDLRRCSDELSRKADPSRPFFGVSIRCGIVGEQECRPPQFLGALRMNGSALSWRKLDPPPDSEREKFFRAGATIEPGFVLNSLEVSSVAHILPVRETVARRTCWPVYREDASPTLAAQTGSFVGTATVVGEQISVCIPETIRALGTHVVSAPGTGKTTLLKNLFLQDVAAGSGAAYIDPHGDAIKDILRTAPENERHRFIYFNPADAWTPCWNPLFVPPGCDPCRLADDFLKALERVSIGWGDRLATVLRHALVGLLHVPGSTLMDLYHITRRGSVQSDALRARVLEACKDEVVQEFWRHDFIRSYEKTDFASSQHKLIKLLAGGSITRMFSQRESRINVREIMDRGHVLLVDLSQLGAESKDFIGSFLLTLFVLATTGRADISRGERRPFSIYVDEAHHFVNADAFEDLMAQARKFRVNLVLAHQYLRQFKPAQIDALLTAGTMIAGRVDRKDADVLAKDLRGLVTPEQIVALPPFEMVARIGSEIARFRTAPDPERCDETAARAVIEQSREKYYVPAETATKKTAGIRYPPQSNADLSFDEW